MDSKDPKYYECRGRFLGRQVRLGDFFLNSGLYDDDDDDNDDRNRYCLLSLNIKSIVYSVTKPRGV